MPTINIAKIVYPHTLIMEVSPSLALRLSELTNMMDDIWDLVCDSASNGCLAHQLMTHIAIKNCEDFLPIWKLPQNNTIFPKDEEGEYLAEWCSSSAPSYRLVSEDECKGYKTDKLRLMHGCIYVCGGGHIFFGTPTIYEEDENWDVSNLTKALDTALNRRNKNEESNAV